MYPVNIIKHQNLSNTDSKIVGTPKTQVLCKTDTFINNNVNRMFYSEKIAGNIVEIMRIELSYFLLEFKFYSL